MGSPQSTQPLKNIGLKPPQARQRKQAESAANATAGVGRAPRRMPARVVGAADAADSSVFLD
jgi:hypothetical protein